VGVGVCCERFLAPAFSEITRVAGDEKSVLGLNSFRDEAAAFLAAVDTQEKEPISEIIRMLDEEHDALNTALDDAPKLRHQVFDMLFLLFELAARENIDLDQEWARSREKKRKYIDW